MASFAFIEGRLNRLPVEWRTPLRDAFEEAVKRLRFGRPVPNSPAENFSAGFFEGTTHATPGTEFSIAHGFARAPYLAIPVLDLQAEGAKLVPLTVTRVADARRIYLSSTVASAPVLIYCEA